MKIIPLTQNKVTLVSDEDFEELNKHKWYAYKNRNVFYALRHLKIENGKQTTISMHRTIVNTPKGMFTDHKDGNGLNNQRENLRVCTHMENMWNCGKQKRNTSGFKGVNWHKGAKKWRASFSVNKKEIHIGYFASKKAAFKAYCLACIKYREEFTNVGLDIP